MSDDRVRKKLTVRFADTPTCSMYDTIELRKAKTDPKKFNTTDDAEKKEQVFPSILKRKLSVMEKKSVTDWGHTPDFTINDTQPLKETKFSNLR